MKEINTLPATPTEDDKVLVKMIADGMSGGQIAKKMKINKNTLAFNLSVLRAKFNVSNSTELVALFLRNGIID